MYEFVTMMLSGLVGKIEVAANVVSQYLLESRLCYFAFTT